MKMRLEQTWKSNSDINDYSNHLRILKITKKYQQIKNDESANSEKITEYNNFSINDSDLRTIIEYSAYCHLIINK